MPITDNANLGKESNVIDTFMLKEYESIAAAHFDCQVGLRQQFRFYLALLAVPLTILGLAFKDRPAREVEQLGFLDLPHFLYYTFIAVGVLGVLMLLAMIHSALDALLYAHTVNGIRAFFSERGKGLGVDMSTYLLMPTDKTRPRYFHVRGFFWMVVFVAVVNTAYIVLPVIALHKGYWLPILLVIGLMAVQFAMYRVFCWIRQRREVAA
jgi:hypothetical protein